jgi:hypothetical protein
VCLAGHEVTQNGSETQINSNHNEKQKEKLAADHFFSSLLGTDPRDMNINLRKLLQKSDGEPISSQEEEG